MQVMKFSLDTGQRVYKSASPTKSRVFFFLKKKLEMGKIHFWTSACKISLPAWSLNRESKAQNGRKSSIIVEVLLLLRRYCYLEKFSK